MTLYQPEKGYCFNSDSLFLYDFISHLKPKGKLLDVGGGCGILGLLLARDFPKISLDVVEKQEIFVKYIQKNAQENKINAKVYFSDFLSLHVEEKYDFIVSNPPFYPSGAQKSEDAMLFQARYDVNLPMEDFFKKVSQLLKPKSHFVFCYDATQFALVCAALASVKMRVVDARFVHPKRDRNATLVMIHARNSSKALAKVHPPLIAFDGERVSEEVKKIYEKAQTKSIKCQI